MTQTYAAGRIGMYTAGMRLILLLMLLLPLGSVTLAAQPRVLRADPSLLLTAAQEPAAQLKVIIQKSTAAGGLEQLVAALGGQVTADLHIINAFAADVPAASITTLAAATGLRWMTLDGLVHSNGGAAIFTTWASDYNAPSQSGVSASLNKTPLRAGSTVWFSALASVDSRNAKASTLLFDRAQLTFEAAGHTFQLDAPAARVSFAPDNSTGTSFDQANRLWNTSAKSGYSGDVFLTAVAWTVPFDVPAGISQVKWTGRMASDTPGMQVNWKWSATAYAKLDRDYTKISVRPNGQAAGKSSALAQSMSQRVTPTTVFGNITAITHSSNGPNRTYGAAGQGTTTFTGFAAEKTPGNAISRVEVALQAYVSRPLTAQDSLSLTLSCNGGSSKAVKVSGAAFAKLVGAGSVKTVYVDVTASRRWQWSDFDGCLQLKVDQSSFANGSVIFYDAIGLRVSSMPGTDLSGGRAVAAKPTGAARTSAAGSLANSSYFDPNTLSNVMDRAVRASDLWNEGPKYLRGSGTTIAVVDSGIFDSTDLQGRIVASVNTNPEYHEASDLYGHGTFVANVAAGDGTASGGEYAGVAPQANIVNVRVSDDEGGATETDVVQGLQWINDNRLTYNIKVVNMSLNSSALLAPDLSPMDAAAEILWFNGVTVVVAAGNNGSANIYPPANDPFVITVGAIDDNGTIDVADDQVTTFSAWGTTTDDISKPDVVAPGRNIVSYLPDNTSLTASIEHPANRVNPNYFRMSGTSMAAPVVAGAAALLLQDEPNLTPDQVKYRLMSTADRSWDGYDAARAGAGIIDIYGAVHGTSTASANTGQPVSQLLWTGSGAVNWNSVNWNSVNWNSVNWNSVNWNSVNWNSVNWNSDYWGN